MPWPRNSDYELSRSLTGTASVSSLRSQLTSLLPINVRKQFLLVIYSTPNPSFEVTALFEVLKTVHVMGRGGVLEASNFDINFSAMVITKPLHAIISGRITVGPEWGPGPPERPGGPREKSVLRGFWGGGCKGPLEIARWSPISQIAVLWCASVQGQLL